MVRCVDCDSHTDYQNLISKTNQFEIGKIEKINQDDLVCKTAIERDLITLKGGVFKLSFKDNSELNKIQLSSLVGRPCLSVVSKDYRIYGTNMENSKEIDFDIQKVFLNNINFNKYSTIKATTKFTSFLETESSGTKFYSNDLLMKLEKGLDGVTEKIFDGSKKINELKK